MRFTAVVIGIFLALTGCSDKKPVYTPDMLSELVRPKDDMAKLVVYYPYSRIWSGMVADVAVQGHDACKLASGNFMLFDVTPGTDIVNLSLCNGNGITQLKVFTDAGHTYYLQVMPNDNSVAGLIAGRGLPVTENPPETEPLRKPPKPTAAEIKAKEMRITHAEGTAFTIDRMEETPAIAQLQWLKLSKE